LIDAAHHDRAVQSLAKKWARKPAAKKKKNA
jgi:hypothetical protein